MMSDEAPTKTEGGKPMSNVYYQPGDFGLTVIAEIEYTDIGYEYDTRVVWRTRDGRLVTARDAGCSCPTPFEQYTSVEELDALDAPALEREVWQEMSASDGIPHARGYIFLAAVRRALR